MRPQDVVLLCVAALSLLGDCQGLGADSFHCITVPSRPGACYYFVQSQKLTHLETFNHCARTYNGRLATFENYAMSVELAKAYHWFTGYQPGQVFRTGGAVYINGTSLHPANCTIRTTQYTFASVGIDVDDTAWKSVFCTEPRVQEELKRVKLCTLVWDVRECAPMGMQAADKWNRIVRNNSMQYLAIEMDTAKIAVVGFEDVFPFICEAPRYPKSFCEPGWVLHMRTRSCFKVMAEKSTHEEAMLDCRKKGASLASINDLSEWELVMRLGMNGMLGNYFGLRYEPMDGKINDMRERRRQFWEHAFNVDGSKFDKSAMNNSPGAHNIHTFPPWHGSQPDATYERCLAYERDYHWHDYSATNSENFGHVCRKMAEQVPIN